MTAARISREAQPDVSVVIPLKDEAGSVATLFERVRDVLERAGHEFEVVFVDDGSTDASPEVLAAMARRDERVRVLRLRRNFGKASALSAGFAEARGRAVITMDADLQDDPEEIPRLLAGLRDGFDVVSGWKVDRRDRRSRRIASRIFNWATRKMSGLQLHDFDCGLKAYSARCAHELSSACYGEMHRFLPVIAAARGFSVTEIPVRHFPRPHGGSRYGWERYLRALMDLFTSTFLARYSRRPLHAMGAVGLVLLAPGGALLAASAVAPAFGFGVAGWVVVLAVVLCLAGVQCMATGLVAELITSHQGAGVPYTRIVALPEVSAAPPNRERAPDRMPAWGERS